jgi:hypothetical protein
MVAWARSRKTARCILDAEPETLNPEIGVNPNVESRDRCQPETLNPEIGVTEICG